MSENSMRPGINRNEGRRDLGVVCVGMLVYVCLNASAVIGKSPQESGVMRADGLIWATIPNEDQSFFPMPVFEFREEARSLSIFRAILYTSVGTSIKNGVDHQMAAEVDTYAREMDDSGWISIWDPEFVVIDNARADSKETIRKAREAVSAFRLRLTVLLDLDAAMSESASPSVNAETEAEVYSGVAGRMATVAQQYMTLLALENRFIDLVESICDLLSSTHGSWVIEESRIVCDNDKDSEMLDRYLAEIDVVVRDKNLLQRKLSARIDTRTNNLWEKY